VSYGAKRAPVMEADGQRADSVAATAWVAARLGTPTEAARDPDRRRRSPGPNQVRVAVETFSLDFNDIDTIHGRYGLLKLEPPFVPGMVAAGVVDAVGTGAEALLGRRVIGVTAGVQGGYATAPARCGDGADRAELAQLRRRGGDVLSVPAGMARPARAGSAAKAGEVVLVHAASGGCGLRGGPARQGLRRRRHRHRR
jgi:NADPH2:quinone reductase